MDAGAIFAGKAMLCGGPHGNNTMLSAGQLRVRYVHQLDREHCPGAGVLLFAGLHLPSACATDKEKQVLEVHEMRTAGAWGVFDDLYLCPAGLSNSQLVSGSPSCQCLVGFVEPCSTAGHKLSEPTALPMLSSRISDSPNCGTLRGREHSPCSVHQQ